MAYTFKHILMGGIMVLLSIYLVINFFMAISSDYHVPASDQQAVIGGVGMGDINHTLMTTSEEANKTRTAFQNQNVGGLAYVSVTGIFGIASNFITFIFAPYSIISNLGANFGIPSIIINTVLLVLTVLIIMAGWSLIKIGW